MPSPPPASLRIMILVILFLAGQPASSLLAQDSVGIAPLLLGPELPLQSLLPPGVRPLFTHQEQVAFLTELEGHSPVWEVLHDEPGEEHGTRLFVLNRERDEAREGHALLNQRLAFLWSGVLRAFVPEHKGYRIALGPELTTTDWGIVRFKPVGLPDEMIAVPPPEVLPTLQRQIDEGKPVEIGILFTGRLIPDESIIYAFSHDGTEEGMIMPVVHIDGLQYFLHEQP